MNHDTDSFERTAQWVEGKLGRTLTNAELLELADRIRAIVHDAAVACAWVMSE